MILDRRVERVRMDALRFVERMMSPASLRMSLVANTYSIESELRQDDMDYLMNLELMLSEFEQGDMDEEDLRMDVAAISIYPHDFVVCERCGTSYLRVREECPGCGGSGPSVGDGRKNLKTLGKGES